MNENVLAGVHCPECGNEDRFVVVAEVRATLIDNGIEQTEDFEWGSNSDAKCSECGISRKWGAFMRHRPAT